MYRVMMTIDGIEVASSCVKCGTFKQCDDCAKRLNRRAHPSIRWIVLPSI